MTNAASITEKLRGEKMDKGMILILVLIGLILGLALVGSELMNPFHGMGDLHQQDSQTSLNYQKDAYDLGNYMKLQDAQTAAEQESIEIARALEPERQQQQNALDAKERDYQIEAERKSQEQALDKEKRWAETQMSVLEVAAYAIIALFFIVMVLAAITAFNWINRGGPRGGGTPPAQGEGQPQGRAEQNDKVKTIPANGKTRRTPVQTEIDPVQALNIRAQNGRCNGHSHGIMGTKEETHTVDDDACEPKYPSNNY